MSDVMLLGVLEMPPDLWRDEPIHVEQRHSRYMQAAQRIRDDAEEIERLRAEVADLEETLDGERRNADLLASEMVYRSNSVQHWHSKATAYKHCAGIVYELKTLLGLESEDGIVATVTADRQRARLPDDLVERLRYAPTAEWAENARAMQAELLRDILAWHEQGGRSDEQ